MAKIDPILIQKCKNNKQRKLANIRAKNALRCMYQQYVDNGVIQSFKILTPRIVNRVQSIGIQVLPFAPVKEVTITMSGITINP